MSDKETVLAYIKRYKVENDGVSPSTQEIADACGISATSTVAYFLRELARENKIQMGGIRNIRVVGGEWSLEKE